MNIYIKTAVLM